MACELARVSKQVTISTRQGTWVTRRVVKQGYPRDVILRTRYFEKAMRTLPSRMFLFVAKEKLRESQAMADLVRVHKLHGSREVWAETEGATWRKSGAAC